MDYDRRHNGWLTFNEHLWLPFIAIAVICSSFLSNLHGEQWIRFFVASFTLMILGGSLVGYAKFPVYRSGRFLTFGIKSVPQHLSGYYRWGWGVFLFGVTLALCLLLSKP